MVPKAKCYSSGDLARSEGWKPGDVVLSLASGDLFVLVAIHKGYMILEDAEGDVTAVDDDTAFEKGGRSK